MIFPSYWEEESQLTFIFFRGVETTNQYKSDGSMELIKWIYARSAGERMIMMDDNGWV